MAATFAGQIDRSGNAWWFRATIAGWGRRTWATSASRRAAFSWSTRSRLDLGYATAGAEDRQIVELLAVPEGTLEESVDVRSGRVSLGALTLDLLDVDPANTSEAGIWGWQVDTGDPLVSQFLGVWAPASSWTLAEDIDTVETAWDLVSNAGLVVGQHLWIGAEVVSVDVLNPGGVANRITVTRASCGTVAQEHWRRDSGPGGEGVAYDRPQYVRGREVTLYAHLIDGATGQAQAWTEGQVIWRGRIEDWEQAGPNLIRLRCQPTMGRLDRRIGRRQLLAEATPSDTTLTTARLLYDQERGDPIVVDLHVPTGEGQSYLPLGLDSQAAGTLSYHARLGDQIVETSSTITRRILAQGVAAVTAYQLLGSAPGAWDRFPVVFRELLLSHPGEGLGTLGIARFTDAATGIPFCGPVDLALALITSTGTPGTNGPWDCLPRNWGAAIPVAALDLSAGATSTWSTWAERTARLRMSRLALGWEGKPLSIRELLETQILGPLGLWVYVDAGGYLALGGICEAYPGTTWTAIGAADIVSGSARIVGSLGDAVGHQTYRWAHDWSSGQPRVVARYRHPQIAERGEEEGDDVEIDAPGLDDSPSSYGWVRARANGVARWWITPLPRVQFDLGLHRIQVDLTTGILLTDANLPNPFTGLRGLSAQPAIVVSRGLDFQSARIRCEAVLLPQYSVGRWAPSGEVSAAIAGQITLAANRHTPAAGGGDTIPATDAAGFEIGDEIMHVDARGAVVSPAISVVTGVGPGELIAHAPNFGVIPVAGDVITLAHWLGGAAPASAAGWTAHARESVAQADQATGLLPDGSAPYVYGGW